MLYLCITELVINPTGGLIYGVTTGRLQPALYKYKATT